MPPSTHPEPARELALLLAGTEKLRLRHGEWIQHLSAGVDVMALEMFLREESTLGLLGRRLQDVAQVPKWFCRHVEEFALAAQQQNVFQQMLTIRLGSALAEAGVRTLPLKGPLLGERLYGNLSARVSADIDLLVAEQDLATAGGVLADLGYRPDRASELGTSPLHNCMVHPAGLPDVELHWRIHWNERRFSADLLSRSIPGPAGCLIPSPADEFVELLLLYARDGFAGLRLAADLAAWWDSYGSSLDPNSVALLIEEHPPLSAALCAAASTAERLVGLPARQLLPSPTLSRASVLAMRLANWSRNGSPGQIKANVSLVDWVLTPVRRWPAVTRRQFLLPPRRKAALGPQRPTYPGWLAWSTALHVVRRILRYCIALLAVAYRGAWAPLPSGWDEMGSDQRPSSGCLTETEPWREHPDP